jgi:regulator of sigma E protease
MIILIIIGVLIIFTILVVAHEFGHFTAARREGVTVEEFGVGFPPRVFSRRKGKTLYSINLFPIGGFVRLKGEDGSEKGKGSFANLTFWPKTRIIMAGVVVNLLIAYLIFTFLLIIGIPPLGQDLPSFGPVKPSQSGESSLTVFGVTKDGSASKGGIAQGDNIVSIDNKPLEDNAQLRAYTIENKGKQVAIVISRNGQESSKIVTLGSDENTGVLGVSAEKTQLTSYAWWAAPFAALILMVQFVLATLAAFGNLIIGLIARREVSQQVSGPIGIVSVFSQIVNFGPRFVLLFVASISLSLAVINALPLPALDGGRQFVLILQKLGLKITPERENLYHLVGFIALISLMIIISISDIARMR